MAPPLVPTTHGLPPGPADAAWWRTAAQAVLEAAQAQGPLARDAVWLLPFAALLPLARRATAELGGWPPRIETPQTLAAQLAPAPATPPGAYSGDARRDTLRARQLMRATAWGRTWAQRDAGAFDAAQASLLTTARTLAGHAATLAPAERPAWWQAARELLAPQAGYREGQLALLAIDWVAAHDAAATDVLFDLRPSLLVALQAGGADALTERLLAAQAARGGAALRLQADAPADTPWWTVAPTPPALAAYTDAEAEAQAVAARVLAELQLGQPVALVALERRVVRRVHALLARAGAAVQDDTGWRLPTTRAGARVMQALRAARARPEATDAASRDAWLAWLKDADWAAPAAVDALESIWRGRALAPARREQADALWTETAAQLAPWHDPPQRPLADWLGLLAQAVPTDPADPAAAAVALALVAPPGLVATLRLDAFITWVDAALEQAVYVPRLTTAAQVVITPLARAMLRPFAAVLVPGADAQRLGQGLTDAGLLTPAQAARLGLPTPEAQRLREAQVLAQVLRQPRLALSWHQAEAGRPLAPSPLLERLALAHGGALATWDAAPPLRAWPATPPLAPLPDASAALWPASLSASALAAWRACPYQFFARTLLGLAEDAELEADRSRADHGSWLHATLERFHASRSGTDDAAELRTAACTAQDALGLTDAALLPFRALFESLVPRYLDWLHARDAEGWRVAHSEATRRGTGLHGRIDRIDTGPAGRVQLLDYKTGSASRLKDALKTPLEDTQLMVYAALALQNGDAVADGLAAAYLPLGERSGALTELPNPDVADALGLWWPAVAAELARGRAGEPLRALGQGAACTHCLARGLCRRDAWADDVAPLP